MCLSFCAISRRYSLCAEYLFRLAVSSAAATRVRFRSSDLETEAAAFHLHGGRRRPSWAGIRAARNEPSTVFGSDYEGGFLQSGDDHDALRLLQKLLWDASIGCSHDFRQHLGRGLQPGGHALFVPVQQAGGKAGNTENAKSWQFHSSP